MKRSILAITLALVSGAALAWNDGLSSSSSVRTDAFATSAGNGYSSMEAGAAAHNIAAQHSYGISGPYGAYTGSYASTHGETSAYARGTTLGNAFGDAGANARQSGYAEGGGYGSTDLWDTPLVWGHTHAGSRANTYSHTRAGVVNNGNRGGFTLSGARNGSVGGVYNNGLGSVKTYGDTDGGAYIWSVGNTHNHGEAESSGVGWGHTHGSIGPQ